MCAVTILLLLCAQGVIFHCNQLQHSVRFSVPSRRVIAPAAANNRRPLIEDAKHDFLNYYADRLVFSVGCVSNKGADSGHSRGAELVSILCVLFYVMFELF